MKNAPAARSNESALEQRRFYTDNPRHCRALADNLRELADSMGGAQ